MDQCNVKTTLMHQNKEFANIMSHSKMVNSQILEDHKLASPQVHPFLLFSFLSISFRSVHFSLNLYNKQIVEHYP